MVVRKIATTEGAVRWKFALLDLAKSVFQVHGTDAEGRVLIRRQLRRGEVSKFFSALPQCVARSSGRIRSNRRTCEASRNLVTIPGIGPITASAITASVPDPSVFQSGRHFAAQQTRANDWPAGLLLHKSVRVASVALDNKIARMNQCASGALF